MVPVYDVNLDYLHCLRNLSWSSPYMDTARVDLEDSSDFAALGDSFDTVWCLNVLVSEPVQALRNIASVLEPDGRLVIYVPGKQGRYCSLDEALGHRCRYSRRQLEEEPAAAGSELESCRGFNRAGVPGWWWNGKILHRRRFGRWQLKAFDLAVPLPRHVDRLLPWQGLGLIAAATRRDR